MSNLDNLLEETLKEAKDMEQSVDQHEDIGKVGVFDGPLGERKVGFVLTKDDIQLYHPTRYGFLPDEVTEKLSDWKISIDIEDYDFITRRTGVYLICCVSLNTIPQK